MGQSWAAGKESALPLKADMLCGSEKSPLCAKVPGKLFLVVANTTNLVTDLRVTDGLLKHLACGMARPDVGGGDIDLDMHVTVEGNAIMV